MARGRGRLRTALARIRHDVVVVGRSGHLGSPRRVVVGSRRLVDVHRVVDHIGRRVDRRSSRVVVECGGGSHRGEDCSHVVDRDDRSSRHRLEVDHCRSHRDHGSRLVSEIGNVRVVVGSRFGAGSGDGK